MIYLASPYSNDPEGNYAAMLDVCKRLVSRTPAPLVFSPVIYFHLYCQDVPYERIMDMCLGILEHASDFVVVCLPEWERSRGIDIEKKFWFRRCNGAEVISYMNPRTLLLQ